MRAWPERIHWGEPVADCAEERIAFFFYSADRNEPPHVHVEHQGNIAKIWIDPVRIADTGGLRRGELLDIERLTREHRDGLLEAWNEFFGR